MSPLGTIIVVVFISVLSVGLLVIIYYGFCTKSSTSEREVVVTDASVTNVNMVTDPEQEISRIEVANKNVMTPSSETRAARRARLANRKKTVDTSDA